MTVPVELESRPLPRPDVVFFDVGDTLVRPEPSWVDVYATACRAYGLEIARADLAAAMRAALDAGGLDELGPFEASPAASFARIRAFDASIMAHLGHRDLPDSFYRLVGETFAHDSAWHVFPDVVPTLAALREAGIRSAVVSNWLWEAPGLLERLGIAGAFDALVISDRVGYNKPHPQIFREALARTGTEASRAIHVGDSYRNDVLGARASGITPVLLARNLPPGDRPAGVPPDDRELIVIRDLRELLRRLAVPA